MLRPGKLLAALMASLCWPMVTSAQVPPGPPRDPSGPVYPVTQPGFSFTPDDQTPAGEPLPGDPMVIPPEQTTAAPEIGASEPAQDTSTTGANIYRDAEIIAIVGNQHILYGDIAGTVNQVMESGMQTVRGRPDRAQIDFERERLTRQVLNSVIEYKIFYQEFERELKGKAKDKAAEARREMDGKVRKMFSENLTKTRQKLDTATKSEVEEMAKQDPFIPRLAVLMKEKQLETMGALDAELRRTGSSLEKQIRSYGEFNLGRSIFPTHVNFKPDVSYLEILNYYKSHPDKYAVPAKARWEHLMVKYSSFKTKDEAWQRISDMGNKVFFGAPLDAVARDFSDDLSKTKGGLHDWTNQGVLASEQIDNALFTLEVGKLSQIIADDRGYHIIRVIERRDAGFIPFTEAQVDIKETIATEKRQASYKKFIADLKSRVKIWTIYDEEDEKKASTLARPSSTTQQR